MFHGKTHYKCWCSIVMLNYQRVWESHPKPHCFRILEHHVPIKIAIVIALLDKLTWLAKLTKILTRSTWSPRTMIYVLFIVDHHDPWLVVFPVFSGCSSHVYMYRYIYIHLSLSMLEGNVRSLKPIVSAILSSSSLDGWYGWYIIDIPRFKTLSHFHYLWASGRLSAFDQVPKYHLSVAPMAPPWDEGAVWTKKHWGNAFQFQVSFFFSRVRGFSRHCGLHQWN